MVAMFGYGMGEFSDAVGKPMPMTRDKALKMLHEQQGKSGKMSEHELAHVISGLKSIPCPWCDDLTLTQMPHKPTKNS